MSARTRAHAAGDGLLMLSGPNLNLLGEREPETYGTTTLAEIEASVATAAAAAGLHLVDAVQSNHEGELIDRLHVRDFSWLIINPSGLTHTSVSLRDALLAVERPFAEVHLSDPATREPFRSVNFVEDLAAVSVRGYGATGYLRAVALIAELQSAARDADGHQ
ncbi:MAG: type II 3-dehydroquinate dehydratase [Chloroflexi bacterium]|nr:type II 3-dehydroquinate dehydratase [Chloroflexota bacterium]